jgi:hypothetical protein
LCQSPDWYRANIFPKEFKEKVIIPKYHEHIEWLKTKDSLKRATNGFESLLKFILTNNDKEIEVHEFEYETFKGESWPSWDDFCAGIRSKDNLINNEIDQFVQSIKQTKELQEFKSQIKKLDEIRNENFWKVFSELNEFA